MDKTSLLTQSIMLGTGAYALWSWYQQGRGEKNQKQEEQEKLSIKQLMIKYSHEFNNSKSIEKIIPRAFETEEHLENLTSNLYYRKKVSHLASLTKSLSEPIYDLLDRGGKRWRPILCMLIAEIYGRNKEEIYDIAALCEIVHNGTLIVDDIEDSSPVRRDKQCVHLLYGVDISINAGNFMYFAPLMYLIKSGKYTSSQLIKIGQIYAEEMTNLHIGQGWDILWHNIEKLNGCYPTENDYLQMTAHKTGVLARLSARLVCVYLNLSEKESAVLAKFAETMGVAFQIQDDLLNLEGEQYLKTKGFCGEDIHEGKITLMVLHYIQSVDSTKRQKLIDILKRKTNDKEEIAEAINLMRDNGSLHYAKNKMHELVENAITDVEDNLPKNKYSQYLHQLAYFGIKRTK